LLAGSAPVAAPASVDLYVGLDMGEGDSARLDLSLAAFGILTEARSAGLRACMEMAGRSLKGQLRQADRMGARYMAIVGPDATVLKDMQDGGQETIETDTVVHAALRGLREL
jgi:histidyl-tRNA synthetase